MKKKITLIVVLLACTAGIWAFYGDRKPDNLPREVAADATQKAELTTILASIEKAFGNRNTAAVSRMYGLSPKERQVMQCENGTDPVAESMGLLGGFGRELKVRDADFIAVERMPDRFYIDGTINDGRRVRISLNRTGRGMFLGEVGLIPDR